MLFKTEHIMAIRHHIKTETRRFWRSRRAVPGRVHAVTTSYYQKKKNSPLILILDVYQQELGKVDEATAFREGGYTLKQFKSRLRKITKLLWDDRLEPWVVEFVYIGEGEEYYGDNV